MGSLDQQVTFKLSHGIQYLHCHPAGGAGQVDATERETMNSNAATIQILDGRAHVHRISAKAVQFRNN
ncbi:hypothetical protein DM40_18 [Burkholderia cenocepacia]|nr:hypothetical protein DM40_18 [Burkholderia cenocepacia]